MREARKNHRKTFLIAAAATAVMASMSGGTRSASAATETWTGAASNLWSGANWVGGNPAPVNADTIVFAGSAPNASNLNDLSSLSLAGVTFNSGAAAYTIGQNAFALTGALTDNAIGAAQVFNTAVNGTTASSLAIAADNSAGESIAFNAGATFGSFSVKSFTSTANTLSIAAGQTFNINGTTGSSVGVAPTSSTTNYTTNLNLIGGGSYNQTGGNLTVSVTSTNNTFGDAIATMDAAQLSSFTYSVTTGTLAVGFGAKSFGTLRLANTAGATNFIKAATLSVGDSNNGNNSAGTSTLALGGAAASNVINATQINIGAGKAAGQINFNGAGGSVTIAGLTGGASTANITLGRMSATTGTNTQSQLNLLGRTATVQGGTVIIGQLNGSTGNSGGGIVSFDTGTFTANSIQLAVDTSGANAAGTRGTFNLGSAGSTGVLNATSFSMGSVAAGSATTARTDTGTFTIAGGTANIGSNLVNTNSTANNVTFNGVINLTGGTLNMGFGGTNHSIGNASNGTGFANNFTVNLPGAGQTATLSNLGGTGITSTANPTGGLLMNGAGTLIMGGTSDYSGATSVTSGTLALAGNLPTGSAVSLSGTGVLAGNANGTIGAVTMASGAGIHPGASGADGSIGTLTLNNLDVNGGNLRFDLAGASSDLLNIAGTANFNSPSTISVSPVGLANGTYTIISGISGGTLNNANSGTLSLTQATIGRSALGLDFGTANAVKLTVNGSAANLTWIGANGGAVWDVQNTQNWNNPAGPNPDVYYDADFVTFNDSSANRTVTLNSTVNPGSVTFAHTSGTYTMAGGGAIAGGGTVTYSGGGTVVMPLTNTYTGVTTISNGSTLQVTNLENGGTNSPLGASPSAAANLVLSGGTLQWTAGADKSINRGFTLGPGTSTINFTTTASGTDLGITGAIAYTGTGARVLHLTGDDFDTGLIAGQTLGGVLADGPGGATSILKDGTNGWQLSSANTFTGGTTVNAGRIRANNAAALGSGSVTIASGAQVFLATSGTYNNNFSISGTGFTETTVPTSPENYGAIRLAANGVNIAGTVTLTGDARVSPRNATGSGAIISGKITGAAALEFGPSNNDAVLILSNTSNDWTGNTTINNGIVRAGASSTGTTGVIPHGAAAGNVTINGHLTVATNSVLDLNGFNVTINGLSSSGDLTRAFVTNNAASTTGTLSVGDNNATSTYGGVLQSGSGGLGINKIGSGTLLLTGNNTHTGGTTVTAGTLQVGHVNALGAATNALTVNGGTLDLNGNSVTVGPLAGGGGVITTSAPGNLTLTLGTAANSTFAGAFQNGAGTVGFTKQGAGTLTLTGSSTANGDVSVNGGTLAVNGSLASGQNISVFSGGTLAGTGSAGNVTLNAGSPAIGAGTTPGDVATLTLNSLLVGGGNLQYDFATGHDLIAVTGAANFSGSSTLTLQSGSTDIPAGTYTLLTSSNLTGTLPTVVGSTRQNFSLSNSANHLILTVSGTGAAANITWVGNLGPTWDVVTTNNWRIGGNPDHFTQNDNVTFDDSASNFSPNLDVAVTPGSVVFDNTNNNYNLTGVGSIGGSGALTKRGGASVTLSLTGGLTYSGATNVQNGTLVLGGSTLPTGNAVVLGDAAANTSGVLDLNGLNATVAALSNVGTGGANAVTNNSSAADSTLTFAGGNSAFGGILKDGTGGKKLALTATSGSLNLSGANTYTGATTVTNGATLGVTGSGTLGNAANVVNLGTATTPANLNIDTNVTTGSLIVASNSATANVINISPTRTLTIGGNVRIGLATGVDLAATVLNMTGGGSFSAGSGSGGTFILANSANGGGSPSTATLDATPLSSFTANYGSAGSIFIGSSPTGTAGDRSASSLLLPTAGTSTLTAGTMKISWNGNNQATSTLTLGQTNNINVNALSVGAAKGSANLLFSGTAVNPALTLRAADGTSRVSALKVADFSDFSGSSSTNPTGTIDFSGGSVNALVDVMTLGLARNNSTGTGTPTGNFTFANGTFDVNRVALGSRAGATQTTAGATGNLTLAAGGTGTFTVNTGGFILGDAAGATNAAMYTGSLTVNGATANIGVDMADGGGNSTLTVNGGTLDMTNHAIGSSGAPIDTLNFQSGSLKNVAQINGGAGLTKTTAGTLTVAGGNAYTGPTSVQGGALRVAQTLSSSNSMDVQAGALLDLVAGGGNNLVTSSLTIAGDTDAWTGQADIRDNNIVLHSTAANRVSDTARITNQLKQGLNATTNSNQALFWSGQGIVTSSGWKGGSNYTGIGVTYNDKAAANLAPGPLYTTFEGQTVGVNDVLVKYTWFGDADLDGKVTSNDYFQIDTGFLAGRTGWINGDFDYNGVVNTNDYFLIDSAFLAQGNTVFAPSAAAALPASSGSSALSGVTAVPEPASITLLAMAGAGVLARRSRRRGGANCN